MRADRKCVYVGATSLPAKERFAQHKSGKLRRRGYAVWWG